MTRRSRPGWPQHLCVFRGDRLAFRRRPFVGMRLNCCHRVASKRSLYRREMRQGSAWPTYAEFRGFVNLDRVASRRLEAACAVGELAGDERDWRSNVCIKDIPSVATKLADFRGT